MTATEKNQSSRRDTASRCRQKSTGSPAAIVNKHEKVCGLFLILLVRGKIFYIHDRREKSLFMRRFIFTRV